jgi:uncharacterized protein YtpQ (UPF0354 family)
MTMLIFKNISFLAAVALVSVALAQEVPREEVGFTDFVAAQLRKQLSDAEIVVKGPLTLSVGELQLNLDRIFTFCRTNRDRCLAEIDNYVRGATETYRTQHSPPTKEAVRLVVRTAEYVDIVRSMPPGSKPVQMQLHSFVAGLFILRVIDSTRTIRLLGESDNTKLGLSADEVYELGIANLRKDLPPLMDVAKVAGHGQIGQLIGNIYNPSRLVLLDSWAPLAQAQGGVLIVAVPATDAVFYVGEDTRTAIEALRTLTKNLLSQVPNKLSGNLYRWRASGWELVSK